MTRERKRSLIIAGHSTSVSLEEPFWDALREMAGSQGRPVAALVAEVDQSRGENNLSSALRLRTLAHFRALASAGQIGRAEPAEREN